MNKITNILKAIILVILLLTISSIPIKLFGIDYENFSNMQSILYNLICNLVFLLILFMLYKKDLFNDFIKFKKNLLNNIEYAFKFYFIGLLIMLASNILILFLAPESTAGNEEMIRSLIDSFPIYMLFQVAIYAPLTEELVFRKSFRDCIKNKYIYILTSGIIFGSLHVIRSITSPWDYLYLIPYCSLGIAFAITYYKSKNIFSTITMHGIHNTLTVLLYLVGTTL